MKRGTEGKNRGRKWRDWGQGGRKKEEQGKRKRRKGLFMVNDFLGKNVPYGTWESIHTGSSWG